MATDTAPKHSPTPWRLTDSPGVGFLYVCPADSSDTVISIPYSPTYHPHMAQRRVDLAHAVACVNGTDLRTRALLAALEAATSLVDELGGREALGEEGQTRYARIGCVLSLAKS